MIRSKKTVIDGITFDSKTEAEYYEYLKKLEKDKKNIPPSVSPCIRTARRG